MFQLRNDFVAQKPILRWAGSKRQMLPKLIGLAPANFDRYIEPFCGSACLFLALGPRKSILADINPHLVNAYNTIKGYPYEVAECLKNWEPTKDTYLKVRSIGSSGNIQDAARFVFLNRYCFNGVYRENLKGEFNVPFGGYRTGKLPDANDLTQFSRALGQTKLVCDDFSKVIRVSKSGDFVYLDPPYSYGGSRNRGQYGWDSFSDEDVARMIVGVQAASSRGVKVLISYNKAHLLRKDLPNWKLSYCVVRRSVAGFSSSRSEVREYQLRNY